MSNRLQEEARPYPFGELLGDQQRLLAEVHRLLAEMVAPLVGRPKAQAARAARTVLDLAAIDTSRHNRTILIDGPRGAEKTVALASMVNLWAPSTSGDDVRSRAKCGHAQRAQRMRQEGPGTLRRASFEHTGGRPLWHVLTGAYDRNLKAGSKDHDDDS